jgi:hypothetical protein
MKSLDHLLCHPVSGRGLPGKNKGSGDGVLFFSPDNPQILVDDMHDLHQLALVLMNPFDKNIEERFGIYGNPGSPGNRSTQTLLVGQLDFAELLLEGRFIGVRFQSFSSGKDRLSRHLRSFC